MARKKTHEEFIKEVFDLTGDEYTVLGTYTTALKKVLIRHNECGRKWEVTPNNFLKGSRCAKCSRRKSNEEFQKELKNIHGSEYVCLDEYEASHINIRMRHSVCGEVFSANPSKIINGYQRCPNCYSLRKSQEKFLEEVYDLVCNEYTVLGEYVNSQEKIKMKHNICDYTYEAVPNHFLRGVRCPKCAVKKRSKSHEDFIEEVYSLTKDEYTVVGKYENSYTSLELEHNTCGHKYSTTPNIFLNGHRCPNCSPIRRKTQEEFIQEVYDAVQDEYIVLGEYINSQTKILMKHNVCDHEWGAIPNNFLISGTRCPRCSVSKGEQRISKWLDNSNISHIHQHRFEDCRNILPLPFDIALIENDTIKLLIEYDGEGHYEPFRYSKDTEKNLKKFKETQRNDQIKNEYCLKNNIPLLRIPYWDFNNIESILEKEIHNKVLN